MRIRSFIGLLFISLIFSSKSLATKNTQNTNYLSKQCKKELLDSKIENPTFKLFKTSIIFFFTQNSGFLTMFNSTFRYDE